MIPALLAVLLCTSPVVEAAPRSVPGGGAGWDLGVASFASGERGPHLGLGVGFSGEHMLVDAVGLRLQFATAFTEFDRAGRWISGGTAIMRWTAGAFGTVTEWAGRGPDEQRVFRLMGAFFAYTFLSGGFALGAATYALAPLSAVSFMDLGLTAAYHPALQLPFDFYVEGGPAGMLITPDDSRAGALGLGPLVGIGVDFGPVGVGARAAWSPEGWSSEVSSRRGGVMAAMVTVSLGD